ncbi:MAG: right-handed parallel beta-helix repeat-containing protein [Vicinamibacterales bacterium]
MRTRRARRWLRGLGGAVLALTAAACGGARSTASPVAPSAPTPSPTPTDGPTVRVSSASQLERALGALTSGTTVLLAAGRYDVPGQAFVLPEHLRQITIAGDTGRREDVVVRGGQFGFWANDVTSLTIRDLTIEGAAEHGVILNCEAHAPVLRNLVLRDIGDQFIKANPGPGGCGVDDGVVEGSLFEYTRGAPDTYTNGVDVHDGGGWTVRGNTFRGFWSASGLVGPAVLFWNASHDTVVEDNTFTDNARDISLGLDAGKPAQPPVSNAALPDHRGGRISRNTITRRPGLPGADVGIMVADSPGTRVDGNTVTMAGTYPNAIEYRFPRTTGVTIADNVVDAAILARDGATAILSNNVRR